MPVYVTLWQAYNARTFLANTSATASRPISLHACNYRYNHNAAASPVAQTSVGVRCSQSYPLFLCPPLRANPSDPTFPRHCGTLLPVRRTNPPILCPLQEEHCSSANASPAPPALHNFSAPLPSHSCSQRTPSLNKLPINHIPPCPPLHRTGLATVAIPKAIISLRSRKSIATTSIN